MEVGTCLQFNKEKGLFITSDLIQGRGMSRWEKHQKRKRKRDKEDYSWGPNLELTSRLLYFVQGRMRLGERKDREKASGQFYFKATCYYMLNPRLNDDNYSTFLTTAREKDSLKRPLNVFIGLSKSLPSLVKAKAATSNYISANLS